MAMKSDVGSQTSLAHLGAAAPRRRAVAFGRSEGNSGYHPINDREINLSPVVVVSPTQQNLLETIRARTAEAVYTPTANRPRSVEAPRRQRSRFHRSAVVDRLNTNHRLTSSSA